MKNKILGAVLHGTMMGLLTVGNRHTQTHQPGQHKNTPEDTHHQPAHTPHRKHTTDRH